MTVIPTQSSRYLSNLHSTSTIFLKFIYIIYLSLAALGLRCCMRAFSSCGERGLSSLQCAGFSLRWLFLLQSMGSRHMGFSRALEHGLNSCGARASLLRGMWDLPGPGLEPVSPALAGGFLTTVPPEKPTVPLLLYLQCLCSHWLRSKIINICIK